MRVTRRQFLKSILASAAALGLSQTDLFKLCEAFASATSPPVIWLQLSSCTGCSVSFLNWIDAATGSEADEVLLDSISLKYHPTVMAAAGQLAIDAAKNARTAGGYVLVVEGAVPAGLNGDYCHIWNDAGTPYPAKQAVLDFANNAAKIISIGTCSSYGGIPAAAPNPTSASGVSTLLSRTNLKKLVNIPGCPPHPDWFVGTVVDILTGNLGRLDSIYRPDKYYGATIHQNCPRAGAKKATDIGDPVKCFLSVGCQGRAASGDCPIRKWNNGINWCVGANTPCNGCTDPSFPVSGLYG